MTRLDLGATDGEQLFLDKDSVGGHWPQHPLGSLAPKPAALGSIHSTMQKSAEIRRSTRPRDLTVAVAANATELALDSLHSLIAISVEVRPGGTPHLPLRRKLGGLEEGSPRPTPTNPRTGCGRGAAGRPSHRCSVVSTMQVIAFRSGPPADIVPVQYDPTGLGIASLVSVPSIPLSDEVSA
ncbi:hypothetical protein DHEL01_v204947 [Diaporthe helianthi]|uniref:Uncharacterized protein n=1 Tax=Diaporthe helianthi TaxID=158607 RepID=A0A2P5I2C5_DIAHE|nr:hypothetical protein DHEL01_v204947 [Diaporthe helianthi]